MPRFVIFCMMRSGSKELVRRLNAAPSIECCDEAEHYRRHGIEYREKREELGLDESCVTDRLLLFYEKFFPAFEISNPDKLWYGNKSILLSSSEADEVLHDTRYTKIIHIRKNVLRARISAISMRDHRQLEHIDASWMRAECERTVEGCSTVIRLLEESGQRWLLSTYDMLKSFRAEERIFNFLNVPAPELKMYGVKQGGEKNYCMIKNREELDLKLRDEFGGTRGREREWPLAWPDDVKRCLRRKIK